MFWILQACTLFSKIEISDCAATKDCIDTFGWGYTCVQDSTDVDISYCDEITTPIPRCSTVAPSDFWSNPDAYTDALVIGQMFDFGTDTSKIAAVNLAYQDILSTGSDGTWVDNRPLVLISCNYANNAGDTLEEKEAVEEVTRFLVETAGVEVIVGPAGSGDVSHAKGLSDGRALFISPSATATTLKPAGITYSDEEPGLFWRTTGPDSIQGQVLQGYIQNSGVTNYVVVRQAGDYGASIANAISDTEMASTGTSPVIKTFEINQSSAISGVINSVMTDRTVEAIVFVSNDPNDILEAVKAITLYPNVRLFLTDSAAKTKVLEAIQDYVQNNETLQTQLLDQIRGTKPSLPTTPLFNEFADRLNNVAQEDARSNVFAAHTYDATWLAALAIYWASLHEDAHDITGYGRAIRQFAALSGVSANLVASSWTTLESQIQNGIPFNVQGTSGKLDYDLETEELITASDVWKINSNMEEFDVIVSCLDNSCTE